MAKKAPKRSTKRSSEAAKIFSTRLQPDLRQILEREAARKGDSLSKEVHVRLRQTVMDEQKLADQFGSYRNALVFRLLANVVNTMRNPDHPNTEWFDDPYSFQLGMETIYYTLYAMRPKEVPDPFRAYALNIEMEPENASLGMLREIAKAGDLTLPLEKNLPFEQWFGRVLRSRMPEIVERAGERANVPKRERLDDDPPTADEQAAVEQVISRTSNTGAKK